MAQLLSALQQQDYGHHDACNGTASKAGRSSHLGSGMMLLDLVTMPLTEISLFMSSGFRSLMTLNSAKLKGRTCAISRFEALAATVAHVCCNVCCTQ